MRRTTRGGLRRGLRRLACGLAATGMIGATLALTGAPSSGASVTKNVIVWAEKPGQAPNYIFPFLTSAYFTVPNVSEFQEYMFRPLYWFGTGAKPVLSKRLSLASAPVSSNGGTSYTITLKSYKWSNGQPVTATNVLFWMNIWHQKPGGYAGWFPGGLSMPTSVKSITITSPTTFTMNFTRSFNAHWLLYNELSEITPLPLTWTRTSLTAAPGSAGCAKATFGTADTACKAVYTFLSEQSGFDPTHPSTTNNALSTYATNKLWQVVDGPWHLQSFGATAPVVMVPNPAYSGPNKPTYKQFVEKPFTTASTTYNALVSGTVDVSYYIPRTDLTSPAKAPTKPDQTVRPGKNNPRLASSFNLEPVYQWGFNGIFANEQSKGDTGNAGPILSQLYVRQAIQSLVTQTLYIDRLDKGYGVPTYGPVPVWPRNPFSSSYEAKNPYPYDPAKARHLLASHGWKVHPHGVSVCVKPGTGSGHCGKGVKKGAKLAFTLPYASGTSALKTMILAETSAWAQAGIKMTPTSTSFDTLVGNTIPCPKGCPWELAAAGFAWIYAPDYYPSGEELFAKDAGSNYPSFNTPAANRLIKADITSTSSLTAYENLIAKEAPDIWQPETVTVAEIHKGIVHPPLSPLDDNTPATWHWS